MKLIRITQVYPFFVFVYPLLEISSKEVQEMMNTLLEIPHQKNKNKHTTKLSCLSIVSRLFLYYGNSIGLHFTMYNNIIKYVVL